jgi:hypothetical protein
MEIGRFRNAWTPDRPESAGQQSIGNRGNLAPFIEPHAADG